MGTFYRIVKTIWSDKVRVTGSVGIVYSNYNKASEFLESDVISYLINLNKGREGLPFRHSFGGDYDCIIRFWDGRNYSNVMAYDIHTVSTDSIDIEKGSYYRYRGFEITPSSNRTRFTIKDNQGNRAWRKSLQDALTLIDEIWLYKDKRF